MGQQNRSFRRCKGQYGRYIGNINSPELKPHWGDIFTDRDKMTIA